MLKANIVFVHIENGKLVSCGWGAVEIQRVCVENVQSFVLLHNRNMVLGELRNKKVSVVGIVVKIHVHILLIAQQDTIGRELQDLSLKKRQRASSKQ